MSHKEEQDQEVEALESIFPNEIEVIEKDPLSALKFTLKTDKYDQDPDDEAKIVIVFKFTANYPEAVPEIHIEDAENIRDEADVISFLNAKAEENLGMAMVYTLICDLIEKLNKDNEERKIFEANEKERKEREREEEEMRRFEGTKVNVESFLRWKTAFDKEMNELKKHNVDSSSKKPTGKQLFTLDESLFTSDLQFVNNEEEAVEVDESLFQELEELNIEDDGDEYKPGDDDDDDEDDEDDEDYTDEE